MNSGVAPKDYFQKYYSTRGWEYYTYLLSQILQFSKPGPILDIGSGAGFLVEACYKWGWSCIGIEGSKTAIELAKQRNGNLNILNQFLDKLIPIESNTFQTVVINQVIEHLETEIQSHCISESYRLLKPGGVIIIHSPCKYNKKEKLADETHINLLTPTELKKLLLSNNFHSLVDINSPLNILGESFLSRKIISKLFTIFKNDRLSSTASFIAYK